MRRIARLAFVAFTVGACAPAPGGSQAAPPGSGVATEDGPRAPAAPTLVFLVRHAEKASDGTKDPPLTEVGNERAQCLARLLSDVVVTHVYATELQRTQQTVAPLAEAAGLETTVVAAGDNDTLTKALDGLAPGSVAVVAGHSNTVPALAASMGTPLPGLDEQGYIPHAQYDRLVQVVRDPQAQPTLVQLHFCAPSPSED